MVHRVHVSLSHEPCKDSGSLAPGEPGPVDTADFCVSAEPGYEGNLARAELGPTDTQTKQTSALARVELG